MALTGYMARYNSSPARQVVGEYVKIAKKHGMTPSELALAWCNQRWTVTSTIIGATKMDQLKVTTCISLNAPFQHSGSRQSFSKQRKFSVVVSGQMVSWLLSFIVPLSRESG